jgi:hypothetical protein
MLTIGAELTSLAPNVLKLKRLDCCKGARGLKTLSDGFGFSSYLEICYAGIK